LRYGDCMTLLRLRADAIGVAEEELPAVLAELQEIEWAFRQGCIEASKAQRGAADGQ
jgi:hypothetical protein